MSLFLTCKFAQWQVPDEFVLVPRLPHTSTGKLLKSELRKQFQHRVWSHDLPPAFVHVFLRNRLCRETMAQGEKWSDRPTEVLLKKS
jgi:hypothetical protein